MTISSGSPNGNHPINVTGTNGSAPTSVMFTVAAPTLTGISPSSGLVGANNMSVTVTGTNLGGVTSLTAPGSAGITFNPATLVVSATSVTQSMSISSGSPATIHPINVTGSSGSAATSINFTVTAATPAISMPALSTTTGNLTVKTGTVTVSNTATGSTAGALTLSAVPTISTNNPGAGSPAITSGTCSSGTVINPGSSCTILISYTPITTATASVTITIQDTGASSSQQTAATNAN
jgi:hypothetical protein